MALITTQKCLQKHLLGLYIICLNIRKFEKTSKIAGLERHVPFTERSEKKNRNSKYLAEFFRPNQPTLQKKVCSYLSKWAQEMYRKLKEKKHHTPNFWKVAFCDVIFSNFQNLTKTPGDKLSGYLQVKKLWKSIENCAHSDQFTEIHDRTGRFLS